MKDDDGSALEIHLKFARGVPAREKVEGKFYSAAKPDFYRTSRYDEDIDVARRTAAEINLVTKFSFKASGVEAGHHCSMAPSS